MSLPVSTEPRFALPVASSHAESNASEYRHVGRLLDRSLNVLIAGVSLVALAPLLCVIAVAIKLDSRGPVFFAQRRIGLDRRRGEDGTDDRRTVDLGGRPFAIFKFRTMTVQAATPATWASPSDRRVTAVGRLLRRYRLDEIPQLLNVVRGEMNIVGPRPEQVDIFQSLRAQIDGYARRQVVPPGITGWAQINNGYDTSLDDVRRKLAFDLEYIRRRSVRHDLEIMRRTLPVMVLGRGGW